ncbi:unnamed protein product [Sympodiomycopsis kandeliae]
MFTRKPSRRANAACLTMTTPVCAKSVGGEYDGVCRRRQIKNAQRSRNSPPTFDQKATTGKRRLESDDWKATTGKQCFDALWQHLQHSAPLGSRTGRHRTRRGAHEDPDSSQDTARSRWLAFVRSWRQERSKKFTTNISALELSPEPLISDISQDLEAELACFRNAALEAGFSEGAGQAFSLVLGAIEECIDCLLQAEVYDKGAKILLQSAEFTLEGLSSYRLLVHAMDKVFAENDRKQQQLFDAVTLFLEWNSCEGRLLSVHKGGECVVAPSPGPVPLVYGSTNSTKCGGNVSFVTPCTPAIGSW